MALVKHIAHTPVKNIFFTYHRNLLSLLQGSEPALRMPVLSAGQWNYLYHTLGRLSLSESQDTGSAGHSYAYQLTVFLPGVFVQLSQNLASVARLPLLVLIILSDGTRCMMGSRHQGARLTYEQSISARGANLTFSYTGTRPIQQVQWIHQFALNEQGELVQYYEDGTTYNLTAQGIFTGQGDAAAGKKLTQEQLTST